LVLRDFVDLFDGYDILSGYRAGKQENERKQSSNIA